jgi:hypothetical protein
MIFLVPTLHSILPHVNKLYIDKSLQDYSIYKVYDRENSKLNFNCLNLKNNDTKKRAWRPKDSPVRFHDGSYQVAIFSSTSDSVIPSTL